MISPIVGDFSDRRGRLAPLRYGLVVATPALLCFTLPDGVVPLALTIIVVGAGLGVFWAPAMAMLSDAAEAAGLDQGLAAALMNLAWAGGQIIGSGGGGALAKAGGDGLPLGLAAGACAATAVATAVARRWRGLQKELDRSGRLPRRRPLGKRTAVRSGAASCTIRRALGGARRQTRACRRCGGSPRH